MPRPGQKAAVAGGGPQTLHCLQGLGGGSGCPPGAGNGRGLCTSCSPRHNCGTRPKYDPYSTEEETEAQRGQGTGWGSEAQSRVYLEGSQRPPAPGLLHELARTGSWGWQLSGKLILDAGFIPLCPRVFNQWGQENFLKEAAGARAGGRALEDSTRPWGGGFGE